MAFSLVVGLIIGIFSTSFSPIIVRGPGLHQKINGLKVFWMILVSPITARTSLGDHRHSLTTVQHGQIIIRSEPHGCTLYGRLTVFARSVIFSHGI
ncbi:hypothetical protein BDV30DRAFT_216060 [Aspergillus minisclerotigenes]|uniref:Uncharacterized protein n=1 Tax=Aspergillus minisclerotigenes TaxID=656917 RepID=A0A5N6IUA8_9EURO|nr:hypothetical protein BDV30DRAFT_216060 [Aspergillus minisclerotigenes]